MLPASLPTTVGCIRQPHASRTPLRLSTQSLASSADEPLNGLIIFKTSGERVSSTNTRWTTGLGAANGFSVSTLAGRWVGVSNMGEIGVLHRRNCSLRFRRRLDDNWRPPFLLNSVFVALFLSWFARGSELAVEVAEGGNELFYYTRRSKKLPRWRLRDTMQLFPNPMF
jgi:hypothetical protein